ncbi:divisome protein SepX/GlpR [Blastococcus sp. SYSU D00695]
MGSGVLLAALVVLWFVVLVPMVVTRGDERTRSAAGDSGRTLKRRRVVDPVVHAETERVSVDRGRLLETGELRVDVHAVRRRTLAGLVALTLLTLVGALVVASWIWVLQVLLDAATVAYLAVLRAAARREQAAARRAARMAARRAARVAPAPRPAMAEEHLAEEFAEEELAEAGPVHHTVGLRHPSLPLAPVHPLRPGRVVAARTGTPAGWQNSAVVGLDDDDIGFADIDEYEPRRVANA